MDLYSRLQPWMLQLAAKATLDADPARGVVVEALESGVVRVTISSSTSDRDGNVAAEGLELLSLLARIDYDQWKIAIQEIWSQGAAVWCHYFQGRRFRLGCQIITKIPGVFTKCCERFLVSDVVWGSSKEYNTIRQELEDMIDRRQGNLVSDDLSIPVRLDFEQNMMDFNRPWEALWLEVVQLASMQAARDNDDCSRHWKPLFRLDEVTIFDHDRHWSKKDFMYARQIAACGIRIRPLRLYDLTMTEAEADLFIPSLQHLMGTSSSNVRLRAVDAVGVHARATAQTLDSVFIAILMNSSVREVHALEPHWLGDGRQDDRQRLWQWIAVTAFRSQSSSTVNKLVLHGRDLTMEDVVVLKETLHAADPISVLFPREGSVPTRRTELQMVQSSSFHLLPPAEGAEPSTFASQGPVWALLLDDNVDDTGYHRVLLPGWGLAWVDPTAVEELKPRSEPPTTATLEPRLHITITFPCSEKMAEYVAFFRAIGDRVRKISLTRCGGDYVFNERALRDIFRSCPHLEELEVHEIHLPPLTAIAEAYEDGSCRAKHLDFVCLGVEDERSVSQFFDHLAGENRLAKHLISMRFDHRSRAPLPRALSSALRMLKQNRTLQEFHLNVIVLETESDVDRIPREAFTQQDGVVLRGRGDALPIKSKTAFLSVVWPNDNSNDKNEPKQKKATSLAFASMDESLITTIFQLAANCKTRLVRVNG